MTYREKIGVACMYFCLLSQALYPDGIGSTIGMVIGLIGMVIFLMGVPEEE